MVLAKVVNKVKFMRRLRWCTYARSFASQTVKPHSNVKQRSLLSYLPNGSNPFLQRNFKGAYEFIELTPS